MSERTCKSCGCLFEWVQLGRGRPRSKCFECSPRRARASTPVERVIRPCAECGVGIETTGLKKFCSERCRYRKRDRDTRVPCAFCGELMYLGRGSRAPGEAMHNRCRIESAGHGVSRYRRGCRCDECRAANTASMRRYVDSSGYFSRPDVVARRKQRRSSEAARDAEKRRWDRYYRENRDSVIAAARDKAARRNGAPTIPFTADQLEDRLSMFAGCWMCGGERDESFHVDHVKPLSKGGWHCLANLRPACGPCNISKGAKWPLGKVMLTV